MSSVLGVLATARNQGKLEGFTINMTSLDDIFLEVNIFKWSIYGWQLML